MYAKYTGNAVRGLVTGEIVRLYSEPGEYILVSPYASGRVYSVCRSDLFMDIGQKRSDMLMVRGHMFESISKGADSKWTIAPIGEV